MTLSGDFACKLTPGSHVLSLKLMTLSIMEALARNFFVDRSIRDDDVRNDD